MPKPHEQIPQIRGALGLYRVMAWITGTFLLLLVAEMVLKYSPMHVELFLGGSGGLLWFASVVPSAGCEWFSLFIPGGQGCEIQSLGDGVNLSLGILIAHGWIYVVYVFSCFRLWSLLRWRFPRLIGMVLGGAVPFLSFIVERRIHRIALAEVAEHERRAAQAPPAHAAS